MAGAGKTPEEEAYERKQEYKAYLHKHGVIEALNNATVALFEESPFPENPLAYIARRISPDYVALEEKCRDLEGIVASLKHSHGRK
ncbi:hypothetical protein NFJ02_20g42060 [Pycnococcus provasolii]